MSSTAVWLCRLLLSAAVAALCSAQSAPPADALQHDRAGRQLLERREWKAAAREFEQAVRLNPRLGDSQIGLGAALWGLGDHDGALAAFKRAIDLEPASAEAHYNVALALKSLDENEKARQELLAALKLRPDYEQAELMLALLLQQSGKPDDAISIYRRVLKRNPGSADAHNWLGVALLQKNALAEAETEFREAIRLRPDYARAYNNLGSTFAQGGDYAKGIEAFEKGLKYAPSDVQLRLNLAMALRSTGKAEEALAQFRSLLKHHPDDADLQYQYAQALRQNGDLPASIHAFEQALTLKPEFREAYYGLGQALKESAAAVRRKTPPRRTTPPAVAHLKLGTQAVSHGNLPDAIAAFQRALELDPNSAEAYDLLGFALGRQGDLKSAVEKLNRAISLDPNLADAHYNLGVALWYSGERANAIAELDEALRLDPGADNAYSFRAMTCRENADLPRARVMLQRAIAINPQNALPYFDLAMVFLRTGELDSALGQFEAGLNAPQQPARIPDLDNAIAELRKALAQNQNPEAFYVLAGLLGIAGADPSQVIASFREAVRLRPDYAEAHNSLGLVYVETGDDNNAIAAFREAIRLRPDYADAHQNLGAVLTSSDAAAAVRELETAVSLDPRLLKAQYNVALAYEASPAHGPAKAAEQLRKLLAMDAKYPRAEFVLGRCLLRQGKVQEAVEHLQRAVEQDPQSGEARYQYGLALSRAGKRDEGAAEIRKSRELIAAGESEQAANLDLVEARAALERGNVDEAIPKLRRVLKYFPTSAEPYLLLGSALEKKGESQEAAAAFRNALDIDPGNAQAKASLQRLQPPRETSGIEAVGQLITEGKFQEAEGFLRPYLDQHPKSAWAWYALGYSLYGQRKIGDSIRALAKSLELNVNYADAHKLLGRTMMIVGRFDLARREFEFGARLDPKSAELPYDLGKLYSIQDSWPDAKAQFESAVRLDPEYMEAYDGLGLALESLGDTDGAVTNYKKAIALSEARNARFASPYVNLSSLYNRTGNTAAAVEYARKALDVNPRADGALFQLGKACEYQSDFAGAADALNKAIAMNPHVSSYFYVLSTVYRKLGKINESKTAMDSFRELERESNELERKRRDLAQEADRAGQRPGGPPRE